MRISHPLVFVIGIAGVFAFFAFLAVMKAYRAITWPALQRRRYEWPAMRARVESSSRVTEAGDFLLVLQLEPLIDPAGYRTTTERPRLRGIARLPERAVTWMLSSGELPVRVNPKRATDLAVDVRALVDSSEADSFERKAFMERGLGQWRAVS